MRGNLTTRIRLRIAIESPNGYSDGRTHWSSGECRLIIVGLATELAENFSEEELAKYFT